MRTLHWCMLGVAILLLGIEVIMSQLCKSIITLVDAFHTFFILMHMVLHPQTAPSSVDSLASPQASSSETPSPPLPAESSTESLHGACGSSNASAQPNHEAAPQFNSNQPCSPTTSPPALDCSVSFADSRFQPVGDFLSSLLLALLSISYSLKILSFTIDPHPAQNLQLVVVVAALSLLYKILVLSVNWVKLQEERAGATRHSEAESQFEVNHKVLAAEESKGLAVPGRVLDDVVKVQSAADDSLCNGALVLCNPGASSVPEADSQTPQPEVHLHAAAPQDSESGSADLKACKVESLSKDITETSKDNNSMGHLDVPVWKSSHPSESSAPSSQRPLCRLSPLLVVRGLFSPLLALIDSVLVLLLTPQCLHGSGACGLLPYLDPVLSLLAVGILIATAMPQVHRYGLLLLQAPPPHLCVSDLGERIAGVHGVQAVHDLHVWQLNESFTVASVHVRCHAGFPAHRCADLMLAVTKVLQSVGVSCCTVQPEFASCSAGGEGSAPSLPPPPPCSLACGKACSKNMCCSLLEEETSSALAPPAGGTKEGPQTLVIENTFNSY
ncbi:zinc transporter 1 [Hippoglossus hippoglossus]|uniref:zinc transporter 1 n=1 Tax=Hippoglossus hippoglossus TaxID=8267 RepID=UPI00148B9B51|nr:zinc transporter 1 [Hippoglossus hippoglossus]